MTLLPFRSALWKAWKGLSFWRKSALSNLRISELQAFLSGLITALAVAGLGFLAEIDAVGLFLELGIAALTSLSN